MSASSAFSSQFYLAFDSTAPALYPDKCCPVKRAQSQSSGWFLELTEDEQSLVETKLALADAAKAQRENIAYRRRALDPKHWSRSQ